MSQPADIVMDRLRTVEEGLQKCERELIAQKEISRAFVNSMASYIFRYTSAFEVGVTPATVEKEWVEDDPLRYESVRAGDVYIDCHGQANPVLRISRFEIALRKGWTDVARRIIDTYPELRLPDEMAILGDGTLWTTETFASHPSPDVPASERQALVDMIRSARKTTGNGAKGDYTAAAGVI